MKWQENWGKADDIEKSRNRIAIKCLNQSETNTQNRHYVWTNMDGYRVEWSCVFSFASFKGSSGEEVAEDDEDETLRSTSLAVAVSLVLFIHARMTGVWSSQGGRGYGVCPPATDMIFLVLGSITLPNSSVSVKRRFLECPVRATIHV